MSGTPSSSAPQYPWLAHYPAGIDWAAEIPAKTLSALFNESVEKFGNRTCLNFKSKKYTYKEVGKLTDRFAKGLQEQGIGPGSTVGLCLPDTPFYPIAYYGALKAGATVANFNPLYTEKEFNYQINDSRAEAMVTINLKLIQPKIENMLGRTTMKKIISCDLADALPLVTSLAFRASNYFKARKGKSDLVRMEKDASHLAFRDLLKNDGRYARPATALDDVAVLQYTSGTTSAPKGAMLTHRNLSSNVEQAHLWFKDPAKDEMAAQEKMLVVLPFYHVFSMTVQMALAMKSGMELVMLPKFDATEVLQTIDREKPALFAGTPTLYMALMKHPEVKDYDLSSLKICMSGGAKLTEKVAGQWTALTGTELLEGYGMSETSPLVVANPVRGEKKPGSIGYPVPGTLVKFVDPDHPEADATGRTEGELCVKGPQVMKGYFNHPAETAHAIDKDGYMHTGDLAVMGPDGRISIVGRNKSMINASGFKVSPEKVEGEILEHPAVAAACVIGVPDDYRGENVKAFIVFKPGKEATNEEITAFLKGRLAAYEVPKLFETRESLPQTAMKGVDRKALEAEEKAKAAAVAQKKPAPPAP